MDQNTVLDIRILALFFLLTFVSQTLSQLIGPQPARLNCYKCVNYKCSDTDDCNSLQQFVQHSLKRFYQVEAPEIPECPDPSDEVGWESLKVEQPNPVPCQGPCTLGRFQVTSTSTSDEKKTVRFGTVFGCPKAQLYWDILYPKRTPEIKGARPKICRFDNVTSESIGVLSWGMRNEMALEHCARLGDICNSKSFCISPQASKILPFVQATSDDASGYSGFIFFVFLFAVIIGVLITLVTFLGIKYDV